MRKLGQEFRVKSHSERLSLGEHLLGQVFQGRMWGEERQNLKTEL